MRLQAGVTLRGEDPQHPESTTIWSSAGHAVIGTGRVLTATCVPEGFAIIGGSGRAIYIQDGATQIIRHNIIRACVNGYKGAAIRIDDEGTAPSILDNTFVDNCSTEEGGVIYIEDASPLIHGNRFTHNQSTRNGGAIVARTVHRPGQQAVITENEFIDNAAAAKGGPIYVELAKPVIQSNQVLSNTAHCGAGIYVNGACATGSALSQRNSIAFNETTGAGAESAGAELAIFGGANCHVDGNVLQHNLARQGDGIFVGQSVPRITNNILSANGQSEIGVGHGSPEILNNTIVGIDSSESVAIEVRGSSFPSVENNILSQYSVGVRGDGMAAPVVHHNSTWMNVVDYSRVDPGEASLSLPPRLIDPANDDYHLRADSPLIDAADIADPPPIEFDGQPRPADGDGDGMAIPDVGADEYLPPTHTPTQTPTHTPTTMPTSSCTPTATATATQPFAQGLLYVYLPIPQKP